MLSWSGYFKVWCEVNKVPFGGYDEISVQAFEEHIPVPGLGKELGEMFRFMDEFGYTGGEEDVVRAQDVGFPSDTAFKTALIMDCSSALRAQ